MKIAWKLSAVLAGALVSTSLVAVPAAFNAMRMSTSGRAAGRMMRSYGM